MNNAQRQGNWEVAARIQYGEMRDNRKSRIEVAEKQKLKRSLQSRGNSLVKDEVTPDEIAYRW